MRASSPNVKYSQRDQPLVDAGFFVPRMSGSWVFRHLLFLLPQDVWDWRRAVYLSDARRRGHLSESPLCCPGYRWAAWALATEREKFNGMFGISSLWSGVCHCGLQSGKFGLEYGRHYLSTWFTLILSHVFFVFSSIHEIPEGPVANSISMYVSLTLCLCIFVIWTCMHVHIKLFWCTDISRHNCVYHVPVGVHL